VGHGIKINHAGTLLFVLYITGTSILATVSDKNIS